MLFDNRFLEELKQRVSLVSVISRFVKLTKRGHSYTGLCPFHQEKTGSFVVDETKGFYHCFGCGAHGDVITFVMNHEHLSFSDAVKRLAEEARIPLPKITEREAKIIQKRGSLYDLTETTCQFFEHSLKTPLASNARAYLEKRKITPATAQKFRLGFSPAGKLIPFLKSKGFTEEDMKAVGLLTKETGREYFRNRLMFPILNKSGKVISFGGRILGDGEPKYLNGPETELFHKSDVLYGLRQSSDMIYKSGEAIVVEGYVDVISMNQSGICNAVAPLGTALTDNHLKLLWTMVNEPTLCFDGDGAGLRAASRACGRALPLLQSGKSLKFIFLPDKLDPDDFMKLHGPDAFRQRLKEALPLFEVVFNHITEGREFNTPERKAGLMKELTAEAEKIPDERVKKLYLRTFKNEFYRLTRSSYHKKQQSAVPEVLLGSVPMSFKGREDACLLLAYLACYPSLLQDFLEDYMTLNIPDDRLQKLKNHLVEMMIGDNADLLDAVYHLPEGQLIQSHVEMLLKVPRPENEIKEAVKTSFEGVSVSSMKNELDALAKALIQNPSDMELFERYQQLKKECDNLCDKLTD